MSQPVSYQKGGVRRSTIRKACKGRKRATCKQAKKSCAWANGPKLKYCRGRRSKKNKTMIGGGSGSPASQSIPFVLKLTFKETAEDFGGLEVDPTFYVGENLKSDHYSGRFIYTESDNTISQIDDSPTLLSEHIDLFGDVATFTLYITESSQDRANAFLTSKGIDENTVTIVIVGKNVLTPVLEGSHDLLKEIPFTP
uniref:Uncharacterized protein n=1 Tax=viral metagenome TaxID=1070528 RepID=A0A6C0I2Q2_9ZZZZ